MPSYAARQDAATTIDNVARDVASTRPVRPRPDRRFQPATQENPPGLAPAAAADVTVISPPNLRDRSPAVPPALTRRPRHKRAHRGQRSQHRQRGSRGGKQWCTRGDSGNLKICTLNIQSVRPKLLELNLELDRFKYDIVVLCETWLRASTPNRLLVFPGYDISRADRKFAPMGHGGIAVLYRSGITAKKINVPGSSNSLCRLESLWNEMTRDYIPPGASARS